ncbi:ATP-binding protein [Thalassospira mesophila]|uniref:ATP-binding protein n=1 Tax=Thalassospira mesophila TaxID=1293891 RepID=UPI000A1FC6C9|nr:ATP-binding protein [Thalassospira mesophila]
MQKFQGAGGEKKQRLFLSLSVLLLLLVSLGLTTFYERTLKSDVRIETDRALSRLAGHGHSILISKIGQYRDTLNFLHATPPISGLTRADENDGLDPFDGTRFSQWKGRLETIFVAMLQNNPEIDQLRVIRGDDDGSELVRVDRLTGKINVITRQWLQKKSGSDYFQDSMKLQPGELYISRINLNREFGRIEYPVRPTIRLATPIFSDGGRRYGFLIMNVNATFLLNNFRNETSGQFSMILTDDKGYYIDHPIADYRFSRDLHPERNWLNDYAITHTPNSDADLATELATQTSLVIHHTAVRFSADPASVMHIYAAASPSWISDQLWKRRIATYGFAGIALLILVFTLAMFMRGYRNSIRLSEARAEHEAIINGSSDAIVGMELDGQISSWSNAAISLLGIPRDSAVGQNVRQLALFPDVDINEQIGRVQETKSAVTIDANFTENGALNLELSLNFSPIVNQSRQIVGIAMIARDVTQERSAERQIRQTNAGLEAQVAKRTQELAEAHQKAIQASEMKSAFISNVSHEMRTPLNGMIGTLNLIKREPLSPSQTKYLAMAETSSSALATLINDILDLSKIEAGKLDFENKPFNPLAMVEAVANSSVIRAREKGIDLVLDTTGLQHTELCGDANRLKQVLNNLISNAKKFTQEGYVAIVASSRLDQGEVRLEFSVEDSGTGIAESNKHKLFAAFSQEDSSISAEYGGTGLGLSICKQLCKLMKGDIGFESTKGKGSRFFFHVRFDAAQATVRNNSTVLSGKRVLILMNQERATDAAEREVKYLGGEIVDYFGAKGRTENKVIDLVMTDRANNRLQELCKIISAMKTADGTMPRLLVVKSVDGNKPHYDGEIIWLSSPLTHSELLQKMQPLPRLAKAAKMVMSDQAETTDVVLGTDPSSLPEATHEKMNLLVVDDNEINLEVAKGILRDTDADVRTAGNGMEALEILRQSAAEGHVFHCVVMDCQMPGMNGFETTEQIRSGAVVAEFAEIPIIAMTANAMSGEREKCIAAGMSDYITKPIEAEVFIEKIKHWSRKRLAELTIR